MKAYLFAKNGKGQLLHQALDMTPLVAAASVVDQRLVHREAIDVFNCNHLRMPILVRIDNPNPVKKRPQPTNTRPNQLLA